MSEEASDRALAKLPAPQQTRPAEPTGRRAAACMSLAQNGLLCAVRLFLAEAMAGELLLPDARKRINTD